MVQTPEQWVENKLRDIDNNAIVSLYDLLINFSNVVRQYLNSPNSLATKGVLDGALECHDLLIEALDKKVEQELNNIIY